MWNNILNNHKSIGIDIDHTLINGPNSLTLQMWIENNHYDYDLHLVTFRHGDDFNKIENDLLRFGISPNWFKKVHGIDELLARSFFDIYRHVYKEPDENRVGNILSTLNVDPYHYGSLFEQVTNYKGKICAENNCSALIDDLIDLVLPGCTRYNIELIDSISFEQY